MGSDLREHKFKGSRFNGFGARFFIDNFSWEMDNSRGGRSILADDDMSGQGVGMVRL